MPSQSQTKVNNSIISKLNTKIMDLKGRKITNSADATDPADLITKRQFDVAIANLQKQIKGK